jgi:F-type H+-transporting ATPase subunit gamma
VPPSILTIRLLVPLLRSLVKFKSKAKSIERNVSIRVFMYSITAHNPGRSTVSQRFLPLDAQWEQGLAKVPWPTGSLPEIMCSDSATLRALIREYLFISLFKACAESLASENASRLAAMQRAEKNIDELLEDLNQTFHRLRQGGIDEELFHVISGFEALSEKKEGHCDGSEAARSYSAGRHELYERSLMASRARGDSNARPLPCQGSALNPNRFGPCRSTA